MRNYRDGLNSIVHILTNFSTHFTLLRTTFVRVRPKIDTPSFKDFDKFHQPTAGPTSTIRHRRVNDLKMNTVSQRYD